MAEPIAQATRQRFRWDVKTLTDPAAGRIDPHAIWTYVSSLLALPVPEPPPGHDTPRIAPWEFRSFLMPVRMMRARSEGDGDIHVVVADLLEDVTMVVELPSAEVGHRREDIRCTRRFFECRFGLPPRRPDWLELDGLRANLYGVGFFDKPHAAGGAPNGIEVHPVIGLSLVTHRKDGERPDELPISEPPPVG